ncbi:hypothetical protein [Chengkuizengella marina]|uniref:Uncharacterized protein n=1 Tax=Chengkuizengella marina TaxID=2507566 RepID=A0A6N9Q1J2_9BACL|nr:hypothetical protein [Chengkuizengella marina]NBI28060.1 hypothetical protein [Chengkuizengella marina]
MGKEEFLKELEEIIEENIFIGNTIDDLDKEISQNNWSFSLTQELVQEFTADDLKNFFDRLLKNRKDQFLNANSKHGMIFYAWFEWQSGRILFTLISDFHSKLPFGREYKVVNNIELIIKEFLNYPYHDGIPIIEIENDEIECDDQIINKPFNIYVTNVHVN